MRFLILHTDYPDFLGWLYAQHPELERQPYKEQLRARNETFFGVADFYSSNLRKLGHEAFDVYANNEFMQETWASEHEVQAKGPLSASKGALQRVRGVASRTPLRYLKPLFRPVLLSLQARFYDILAAQIRHLEPDVILNQAMHVIDCGFLREMKSSSRLLVGQNAATPLPGSADLRCYDLAISSFPPTVQWFRAKGIPAELHSLAFEPKVLDSLQSGGRAFDIAFIGAFHKLHTSRVAMLETLSSRFDGMRIWGPGVESLPSSSPIRKRYVGQAWGKEMYQILHDSKIAINHHGDVGPYANNLRMYEATGVGTLLVTDWKMNLHELFEPGKEIVAYRNAEECAQLIEYYLRNDREREDIARAGQRRTLGEHTFLHRMQQLVEIVAKHL